VTWSRCKEIYYSGNLLSPQPDPPGLGLGQQGFGAQATTTVTPAAVEDLPTISSAAAISASPDIKPILASIAAKDDKIKNINVNENKVEIKYQAKAKLFGFIPLNYNLAVSADTQNNKIQIKKPWWLFLTTNNANDLGKAIDDAANSLNDNSELESLNIQDLLGQRAKAVALASNLLAALASTTQSIVNNIK
jgi:hypothetical protein